MRLVVIGTLLLCAAAPACSDPADPAQAAETLRISGTVRDDTGAPIGGAYTLLEVWYSRTRGSPKYEPERGRVPFDVTGPDGTYLVATDGLDVSRIDSVGILVYTPGCSSNDYWTSAIRGGDLPGGPDPGLTLDVVAGPPGAVVATAVGQVCAEGIDTFGFVGDYTLFVRTDSIAAGVVHGRWSMTFAGLRVNLDGSFQGVEQNGMLVLVLTRTPDPFEPCSEFRLAIPIGIAGSWGTAGVLRDDQCIGMPAELTFAPNDWPISE